MKVIPREGFLKSKGFRLHYLIWGASGAKLILLHSMGMDAHSFDEFSNRLGKGYQILAFDILDHGDSEKPKEPVGLSDHAEIIRNGYKQLGFFPNVLIGHSIGGMIGMVLAAEHPEELNGLVLVDIAPMDPSRKYTPPPQPPEFFKSEDDARKYLKLRYPYFADEYLENRLKYAFTKDEEGRLKLKPYGDIIRRSLFIDLWPYLEKIKIPTLLILGKESTLVSPATVDRMRKIMPQLQVSTIENASHMVPQDRPAEFEDIVRRFLEKIL
ncbi:MAG: alpha/beta fold hydrolase [Candidatus Bathyarchaeia archaeon]